MRATTVVVRCQSVELREQERGIVCIAIGQPGNHALRRRVCRIVGGIRIIGEHGHIVVGEGIGQTVEWHNLIAADQKHCAQLAPVIGQRTGKGAQHIAQCIRPGSNRRSSDAIVEVQRCRVIAVADVRCHAASPQRGSVLLQPSIHGCESVRAEASPERLARRQHDLSECPPIGIREERTRSDADRGQALAHTLRRGDEVFNFRIGGALRLDNAVIIGDRQR
jgi:hypothetical protein